MFKDVIYKFLLAMLLCVLLTQLLGCASGAPFPALSAPTPDAGSATSPVTQTDEPRVAATRTPSPVSQADGQEVEVDRFIAGVEEIPAPITGSVPVASMSNKIQQMIPAVVKIVTGAGTGSGVIVQTQGNTGFVVTNHPVTRGGTRAQVTVKGGATYQADVLGVDAVRDLAVLKICCGGFSVAQFGDTASLEPTTEVLVVGYPRGMSGPATITRGIVSAVRFDASLQSQVIQTDAAINPGNSGGPVVSLGGEVLGITTFKYMDSGGIGFAIPSNTVIRQLPSLWASDQNPPSVPPLVPVTSPDANDELEARIHEAIQELIPTLVPTQIPTPQLPQTSVPSPISTPITTPLPPVSAPTLTIRAQACLLAAIPPLDELELEYFGFMAGDPYTNSVSSDFRETLTGLFPEVTAAYILEFLRDPGKYPAEHNSYRKFLEAVGYQAANRDFREELQRLRRADLLPDINEPMHEWSGRQSDPCTLPRLVAYSDDALMALLALETAKGQVNPWMQEAVTRITVRDIRAFRNRDPTTPLIYLVMEIADRY